MGLRHPSLRGLLWILLVLALGPAPLRLGAQAPRRDAGAPDPGPRPRPGLEENRKRWEKLPPERRQSLERLYERLKQLDPAERHQILERLRAMDSGRRREVLKKAREELEKDAVDRVLDRERKALLRRELEKLPPAERDRLLKLPPDDRRRLVEAKVAERVAKLLSRSPPHVRERIEKLPPREQIQALERLRAERAFQRTFQDPAEVERLRSLPPRAVAEGLRAGGHEGPPRKPELLSDETWRRWLELKPRERPAVLRHLLGRPPGPPRARPRDGGAGPERPAPAPGKPPREEKL